MTEHPRIWVPKFKTYEAQIRSPVSRVDGFFMLEACNRYGGVRRTLGPWRQLITDQRMSSMFNHPQSVSNWCFVGTGSSSFVNSDTGLTSPSSPGTSNIVSSSASADLVGTENYREVNTVTHEFGLGDIVANISEVGNFTSNNNTSGSFLDLVRDGAGNPTTFPVTADDILRVTHILHLYPFLGTIDSSFVIGGDDGSGTHDYLSSIANLDSSTFRGSFDSFATMAGINANSFQNWDLEGFRDVTALGDLESDLTGGTSLGSTSANFGTVSNDGTVWTRTQTFNLGLSAMNHVNGINGFRFYVTNGRCGYKFFIDPPIPKYESSIERILDLEFSVDIARGTGTT